MPMNNTVDLGNEEYLIFKSDDVDELRKMVNSVKITGKYNDDNTFDVKLEVINGYVISCMPPLHTIRKFNPDTDIIAEEC